MASSIRFSTQKLGFSVEFTYQDFYAGIRAGSQIFHLKLVDELDPSTSYVDEGGHLHLYLVKLVKDEPHDSTPSALRLILPESTLAA